MSTTPHDDADRESLSALFDGELDGAAARFAAKRLDHDAQWREACGRWQLVGDALRGQVTGVAPAGFAARVGAALHDDGVLAAAATGEAGAATPRRRHWIGGAALAASVAVAALFVVRPFSQPDVASPSTAPAITSAQPAPPMAGAAETVIAQSSPPPASPTVQAPVPPVRGRPVFTAQPATTVATADVPPRAGVARALDPAESTPARRPVAASMTTAPVAVAALADAGMPATGSASPHPFLPPGEIVSRPWPRAALSGYPSGNAFNVSLDSRMDPPGQPSSSFYPFDPRMLDAEPSSRSVPDAPATEASDWPRR